ncbi:MAG: RluA family pseudouridine synthase [Puniceicoccales bacterium]|jgi:23S rRNA pseudouridine1911/1915/1917 synthase|nr:RluA family pseudouridine synthase [Puniceicoccales bacterium]
MIGEEVEFVATGDAVGQRIDKFLSTKFQSISRTQIQKSFAVGLVKSNGVVVPAKYVLRGGELVKISPLIPDGPSLRPVRMPLAILFEDDDVIAVDKPAGIATHAGSGTPVPTLVDGVLGHCKLSALGGELRPGVVHRLDRDTSGAIIFAKTDVAHLRLSAAFAARRMRKTYRTIVCGTFAKSFGEIKCPVGRNRCVRTKMAVTGRGREAITRWHALESFGEQFSHLKVSILTGRTHQIRVHMAHVRHPIIGDMTYGYSENYSPLVVPPRTMLHAAELAFQHPRTGVETTISAQLPADFLSILRTLRENFHRESDALDLANSIPAEKIYAATSLVD